MTEKSKTGRNEFNIFAQIGFGFSVVLFLGNWLYIYIIDPYNFFGSLLSLVTLVLGVIALVQIKYTHQRGKWFAIVAIATSFVYSMAGAMLLGILAIYLTNSPW